MKPLVLFRRNVTETFAHIVASVVVVIVRRPKRGEPEGFVSWFLPFLPTQLAFVTMS